MGIVATQLDKLANAKNCRNSTGIAELLHVSRSSVSLWRSGDAYPDEERIAHMARLAGADPAIWLAEVRAERTTGEAAKAWRDALRRLAVAATIMLSIGVAAGLARFRSSHATSSAPTKTHPHAPPAHPAR
jgi:transcriptional regulator with XRE-family HTH domain